MKGKSKSFRDGTSIEAQFKAMAETRGWKVHRSGWPDFLLTVEGKRPVLVEVKSQNDRLSAKQVQLFATLETLGLRVRIWWEGQPDTLIPWRKFHTAHDERLRPESKPRDPKAPKPRRLTKANLRALRRSAWIDRELGRH